MRMTDAVRLPLHPGQQAVFRDPTRFRVVVAGRRWGKTQLALVELVVRALKQSGRFWYVQPTLNDAKDTLWNALKATVAPSWLAQRPNESELKILLRGGGEIRLFGAENPDRLRGRGVRFVVLDEFADMKPETWDEVLRPALADYQAPALFIGTPRSFNHLHKLYVRGQDPTQTAWASWQFFTRMNPFIPEGEVVSARRDLDPRTFRQEWEASFEAMRGRAYYAFSRVHHVRPVTLDPLAPACLFFDFNIHPATAGIGQKQGNRPVVWREVWIAHAGGEATRATALAAKRLLTEARHRGEVRIYGDPAGKAGKTTGPADHAVLKDVFPGATWCIPAHHPHVKDRVTSVNAVCETVDGVRRLIVDPSCPHLIADLEQVIYADNGDLDKRSEELTHLSDGLGYWIERDFPVVHRTYVATVGVSHQVETSQTLAAIKARKHAALRDSSK